MRKIFLGRKMANKDLNRKFNLGSIGIFLAEKQISNLKCSKSQHLSSRLNG
jgi:hypothetical protein